MIMSSIRVAFIYAPFGSISYPALGISQFKNALFHQNIDCDILYFNIEFAKELGTELYETFVKIPHHLLFCEWLFSSALYGENSQADRAFVQEVLWDEYPDFFSPSITYDIMRIREQIPDFFDTYSDRVDWSRYDIIGFSSVFQQQCASLALAKRIKSRFPNIKILFGGSNCHGTMGENLPHLFPFIDFVCTGEGDIAVPALVREVADGNPVPAIPGIVSRNGNSDRLVFHPPSRVNNLDDLPYPDFSDYFSQIKEIDKPEGFESQVLMEASRGCWWGEKSKCTFCGFNGNENKFRCKSSSRVLEEVQYLSRTYGNKISFVDNVLGKQFFETVIPELASFHHDSIFLELKADLTQEQIAMLAQAGITRIHAGIETLSNPILLLIRKGTNLAQNLQTMKWGKKFGITVNWNLIYGFPGEDPDEYHRIIELVPKIIHLQSPHGPNHLRFDRFSDYHSYPEKYGITHLKPKNAYKYVYHSLSDNDIETICYIFDADYDDKSELYGEPLRKVIREWQSYPDAELKVFKREQSIHLIDTRTRGENREYTYSGLAADVYLECDTARSMASLIKHFQVNMDEITKIMEMFVNQGIMVQSGNTYLSLAIEINEPESHRSRSSTRTTAYLK